MTIAEIVEKIGKYNITIEGDSLRISGPSDWVKKNADLIRANKPEIMVYMAGLKAQWAEEARQREAKWAAKKAAEDAADKPLLDVMQAEAERLRNLIPGNHLQVTVKEGGDADGWKLHDYIVDGIKVNFSDVVVHGWASAIRPGAIGAFAEICVASISRDRLEEIKAAKVAAENKKAEAEKAEADRIAAIFVAAQATGKRQELEHFCADCNDPHEECSTDVVTVWAMPDGTKKTTRVHTW